MQKIPMNNFVRRYKENKKAINRALGAVLKSGWFVMGPELKQFETAFARYLGAKHVVSVHSGTDALYLALRALDVGAGDEVITVAHTATPTISAIRLAGATPVFVDILEETFNMDPVAIERKITRKTKIILPVHLYGYPADMDRIMRIAKKHKLFVLEDCAQATGSTYKGKKVGTIGHINAFSFYPTKNLGTFGDGGAIATDDPKLAERVRWIRQYGEIEHYKNKVEGINSRLEELQSAILNWGLPKLTSWNKKRAVIAAKYIKGLTGLPIVLPVSGDKMLQHAWHLFVIRTTQRDALKKFLAQKGIATGIHYPTPVHLQEAYRFLRYRVGDLPVTERIVSEILSLPISPELSKKEQEMIIAKIKEFFKK
jgi:dTDP-4-amino-4,6-dideoxygalactose transaminase